MRAAVRCGSRACAGVLGMAEGFAGEGAARRAHLRDVVRVRVGECPQDAARAEVPEAGGAAEAGGDDGAGPVGVRGAECAPAPRESVRGGRWSADVPQSHCAVGRGAEQDVGVLAEEARLIDESGVSTELQSQESYAVNMLLRAGASRFKEAATPCSLLNLCDT